MHSWAGGGLIRWPPSSWFRSSRRKGWRRCRERFAVSATSPFVAPASRRLWRGRPARAKREVTKSPILRYTAAQDHDLRSPGSRPMPRMIELIRQSAVPSHILRSAALGSLSLPPAEVVELLVFLTRNPAFGKQARMTLAGWDEAASIAIAGDPAT